MLGDARQHEAFLDAQLADSRARARRLAAALVEFPAPNAQPAAGAAAAAQEAVAQPAAAAAVEVAAARRAREAAQ